MAEGGVLTRTIPRGPVAAQYKSPGPCYGLPGLIGKNNHDPRSVHSFGPAFPFGVRHGKFKDDCSPGPCHYPNPMTLRHGKDGTPHYSLYSRTKDIRSFPVPGPGAYSPQDAGPNSKCMAPKYSFGTRHRSRRSDNTPAPNTYTMDPTLGQTIRSSMPQAPMYTINGRSKTGGFHEDLQRTPGPGTYNATDPRINKNKCPIYSMTSRNVMPGDSTQKPGPGAHSPEKVYINKRKMPSVSFGIKHSEFIAPMIVECND